MDFSRRLRLFLIGVVLGSVIMYFWVLKDKNIYKMPKDVIKEKLLHLPLQLTSKAKCQVECNNIDTSNLRKIWKDAEIDFSLSQVSQKPCPIYHLSFKQNSSKIKILKCSVCDEFAVLQEIIEDKDTCNCKQ